MTDFKIFFLLVLVGVTSSAKLPSNWTKCPKTNNEECLKESVTKIFREIKNGRKDVGIVPIDPLRFDRMEVKQEGNGPTSINIVFTDLDFFGASRMRLIELKADWDKYIIFLKGDYPGNPVGLTGNYEIDGKILVLPIQGKGKCNITMETPSVEVTFKGKEVIKNGKKYVEIVDCNCIITPGRTRFWFGNLFEGVPNLGDNMNKFMNDNWREITDDLISTLGDALGLGLKEVANGFFHKVPVDELYS